MTAMLPAHLTESLNNLGDTAAALTAEVRADREGRRRHDRRMLALLVVLSLLVVGLATLGVLNRRTNTQNAELIEQIKDCTSADGECYREGQRRTADAVAELVRAQMLVELCARDAGNDTQAELERCVAQRRAQGG